MKTQRQQIKLGSYLENHPNITLNPNKNRNLSALSPLLKKSGVHDQNNPKMRHKKDRKAIKLQLQKSQWMV